MPIDQLYALDLLTAAFAHVMADITFWARILACGRTYRSADTQEPPPPPSPITTELTLITSRASRTRTFSRWHNHWERPNKAAVYQIASRGERLLCLYARYDRGVWYKPQPTPGLAARSLTPQANPKFKWRSLAASASADHLSRWHAR